MSIRDRLASIARMTGRGLAVLGLLPVAAAPARAQGPVLPTKLAPEYAVTSPLVRAVPQAVVAVPQAVKTVSQAVVAVPQAVVAAPQVYPSGQFATPQTAAPCACYFPQGYCPFPSGNCVQTAPVYPSIQWPVGSSQFVSPQSASRGFAPESGLGTRARFTPTMIGD